MSHLPQKDWSPNLRRRLAKLTGRHRQLRHNPWAAVTPLRNSSGSPATPHSSVSRCPEGLHDCYPENPL